LPWSCHGIHFVKKALTLSLRLFAVDVCRIAPMPGGNNALRPMGHAI
jgi:hypothetical protein